jgi:hypothetical protein
MRTNLQEKDGSLKNGEFVSPCHTKIYSHKAHQFAQKGRSPRGGLGLEPRIAAQRQRAGEPRRCSRWPKLHLTRISLRAAISRLLVVLSSYRPRLGFSR